MKKNYQVIQVHQKVKLVSNLAQMRNLAGVEYAVYPCVLLVEGVHQGSGQDTDPVFYSAQVLQEYAPYWNNVPVTMGHPKVNGRYVMCNTDGTIRQQYQVGYVSNARYENGKLKAELWLNVALVEEKAPGLLQYLENDGELDVSTGLLAGQQSTAGTWNEENYLASVLEMIPDHLALLPGATGACSWADGCGVRVNQGKKEHNPIYMEQDLYKKIDKIRVYVDNLDIYNPNDERHEKINHLRAVYEGYFIYEERLRDGTASLLKQEYSWNEDDELDILATPVKVVEEVTYIETANEEDESMAKKVEKGCCPEKVKALITNENNAFTEEDQEWLEAMNEDQLEKLIVNSEPVDTEGGDPTSEGNEGEDVKVKANNVAEQITDFLKGAPAPVVAFINEGMRTLDEKRGILIQKITSHEGNKFTQEQLTAMETVMLENVASMIPAPVEEAPSTSNFSLAFPAAVVANEDEVEPYLPTTLSSLLGKKKE